MTVLPLHDPILVPKEAATVDLLGNGRLDFGIGRGFQWGEYHRLNIPMEEANLRFEEAMEVITKAWTLEEPFDHHGEFWNHTDITIHPRPVQSPSPPVWVAASSPASMDRAARAMYTAATVEQTRRDTHDPLVWFKQTGNEVGSPPDHNVDLLREKFSAYRGRFARDVSFDHDAAFDNVALFGMPDQVAGRIEALRENGVENLIFFVNYGGIESQKVMDSMEMFAREVMPRFAN